MSDRPTETQFDRSGPSDPLLHAHLLNSFGIYDVGRKAASDQVKPPGGEVPELPGGYLNIPPLREGPPPPIPSCDAIDSGTLKTAPDGAKGKPAKPNISDMIELLSKPLPRHEPCDWAPKNKVPPHFPPGD